jgi:hypothetical protein
MNGSGLAKRMGFRVCMRTEGEIDRAACTTVEEGGVQPPVKVRHSFGEL